MRFTALGALLSCYLLLGEAPAAEAQADLRDRARGVRETAEEVTSAAGIIPTGQPTRIGHSVEQKQAAWKRMDELLTDYTYFASGHGMADKVPEYADRWARFTDEWTQFAPEFFAAYGATADLINQALQGIEVPEGARRHPHTLAADALAVDVPAKQKQIVQWADEQGTRLFAQLEAGQRNAPDRFELHLRRATRIAQLFTFAEQLAPGAHTVELERANQLVAEFDTANLATIATVKWPGLNPQFKGTDTPDALAAAAIEFLKNHPRWSKPEYDDEHIPYIAAVRGSNWEVNKRAPLTGVPTQYRLDIVVGFKGKKNTDVLYVYQMVFYTEEAAGVAPKLPFRYANSRQYAKHQMLLANAPKP